MLSTYKTIANKSEGIYKDKGSKFFSFAVPTQSVDGVKELVKNFKEEFHDARHICYAYVIGIEHKEWRANDDGEPAGTAGRPILGQINSRGLTNILVVVVRYFGGILLGTSGLATAYREAAADALNHAEIVEKTIDNFFTIRFNYSKINEVIRLLKEFNGEIFNKNYDKNEYIIEFSIPKKDAALLISKLKNITGLTIEQQ
ncbi:MAG TPA: YigZ family protein [Paludibacteraceae bacterium]|nr:YigZ family protein [Paludibacteraceae bacterium]HPO67178.1 YigZ family protein [Paludibacteraceae bacterium]HRU63122.1 YigZ family protein [Paludibacteraceae bacterium]